MTDKQLALKALEALPENVSLHDIREELAVLESIQKGQDAAREGRNKPQAEVEELFASWTTSERCPSSGY